MNTNDSHILFSSSYPRHKHSFPRIEAIRYDKPWSSCLSLPELQAIAEGPARGGALEAMLRSQGKPLLSKRSQRKSQSQLQSQLLVKGEDPFSQLKEEGGAGPLLAPRAPASHRPPPPVRVVGSYRTVDEGSVERKDELLQGLEFCVMGDFDLGEVLSDEEAAYSSSGGGSDASKKSAAAASVPSVSSAGDHRLLSKADVEKMILEHGGRLTGSPRAGETALVLAPDAKSFRVKLLVRSGKFDVVGLPYLLRCIREGKLTRPRYLEYLFMTKDTRARLKEVVDEYGDAYASYTTPQALARCMRHIKLPAAAASSAAVPMQQRDVGRLPWRTVAMASLRAKEDHLLLFEGSRVNFLYTFGRHVIYLDRFPDLGPMQLSPNAEPAGRTSPLPVTRLDHLFAAITLHGGVVSDALHMGVTHVVVHWAERARFPLLAARLKALRRLPVAQVEKWVVGSEWVEECLAAKKVVPVEKRHLVALR